MARQRVASAICSSIESQFFSHTAPGAIDTASRARGNPDSRLDTHSLSRQDPAVGRDQKQHYFKCPACRWFGPLTADEIASVRVNELGTSPCPRCGQAGYLDPALARLSRPHVMWIAVAAVVALAALVAVLDLNPPPPTPSSASGRRSD
jgi:hypothetical protein